jgi:hypothetical protein
MIADAIKMSAGSTTMTREDAVNELNRKRVEEGKAPFRVNYKDIARADKLLAQDEPRLSSFREALNFGLLSP